MGARLVGERGVRSVVRRGLGVNAGGLWGTEVMPRFQT